MKIDDPSVAKVEIWEDEDFYLPPSPSSVFWKICQTSKKR